MTYLRIGVNFLTFSGTEGASSLHQSLHFEPVKYIEAAAFRVAGLVGSFASCALLFFLPVVYLLRRVPASRQWDRAFTWLVAVLYCLYPSVLLLVTWDLRPYALLLPFFALGFLALHVRARPLETVALFNLLFLAREEALVFSLVLIFYAMTCARGELARHYRRILPALALSWVVWVCATIGFFAWAGYPPAGLEARLWRIAVFLASGSVAAAALRLGPDWCAAWTRPAALALIFVPLWVGLREYYFGLPDLRNWLYDPRLTLYAGCALLLLIPVWDAARARWARLTLLASVGLMVVGAVVAHVWPTTFSAYGQYRDHAAELRDARVVFALRARADRLRSIVLTDLDADQAFFDFENLYVLERPAAFLRSTTRDFPRLLSGRVEYIAVSTKKVDTVLRTVHALRTPARIEVLGSSPRFATYRVVW